jgi:hypothetical protein
VTSEDKSIAWGEVVRVSSMPGYSSLDITTKGKKRVETVENVIVGKQWSRRMIHDLVLAFGLRRNR